MIGTCSIENKKLDTDWINAFRMCSLNCLCKLKETVEFKLRFLLAKCYVYIETLRIVHSDRHRYRQKYVVSAF